MVVRPRVSGHPWDGQRAAGARGHGLCPPPPHPPAHLVRLGPGREVQLSYLFLLDRVQSSIHLIIKATVCPSIC